MRFELTPRGDIPESEEWMRHLTGSVYFDIQGKRYYRPDHMSRASPEAKLMDTIRNAKGDWYITFTDDPEVAELIRLLKKFASVTPFWRE